MVGSLRKAQDGTLEETLGESWTVAYSEEPATGLWTAVVYKHDVIEWRSGGYASLEDARQAAEEFYKQV